MNEDTEWLTPAQAAPLLKMHPKTVRELCADRRIERRVSFGPAGQPRYKISRAAIRAFIRQELAA